jgi:hypothetical protein
MSFGSKGDRFAGEWPLFNVTPGPGQYSVEKSFLKSPSMK